MFVDGGPGADLQQLTIMAAKYKNGAILPNNSTYPEDMELNIFPELNLSGI
jgi:hypothetical protein